MNLTWDNLFARYKILRRIIVCYGNFYYLCNENAPARSSYRRQSYTHANAHQPHSRGKSPPRWQIRTFVQVYMIGAAKIQLFSEMTLYEILNFNRELLKRLISMGFKPDDCRFIELYRDYEQMRSSGEKVTYIVSVLSERYGACERKIYNIIKHMETDCTSRAV